MDIPQLQQNAASAVFSAPHLLQGFRIIIIASTERILPQPAIASVRDWDSPFLTLRIPAWSGTTGAMAKRSHRTDSTLWQSLDRDRESRVDTATLRPVKRDPLDA